MTAVAIVLSQKVAGGNPKTEILTERHVTYHKIMVTASLLLNKLLNLQPDILFVSFYISLILFYTHTHNMCYIMHLLMTIIIKIRNRLHQEYINKCLFNLHNSSVDDR